MTHANRIIDGLRKSGHRITTARSAIVETLTKHHTPLAVPDFEQLLRTARFHVSTATIYRELSFLEQQGIARHVRFADDIIRFELASLPHHHHLVCLSCNDIQDFVLQGDLRSVERRIRRQKRFSVEQHALEFYGRCAKCA